MYVLFLFEIQAHLNILQLLQGFNFYLQEQEEV
jgi:hypothetical protein